MVKIQKFNSFFRGVGQFELKYRFVLLVLIALISLAGFFGLKRAIFSTSQGDWFSKTDPLTIARENFENEFGNNDYIAVLVEAEDVFDPVVLNMIRDLGNELLEKVPYTNDVTSLTELEISVGTEEGIDIINPFEEGIPEDKKSG